MSLRQRIRRLARRALTAGRLQSDAVRLGDAEVVEYGYRLLLGQAPTALVRKELLERLARGTSPTKLWASICASPEFLARVSRQSDIVAAVAPPVTSGFVDVQDLKEAKTLSEHNSAAERYMSSLPSESIEMHLAKPFTSLLETPELLTCFGHAVAGLRPLPGMVVLDFAAGTGWTSWYFAQLGCQVIVCDVSPSALAIARERFRRWKPAGARPEPTFLTFDGIHLDVPDGTVDRVCCFDAFHHLINQLQVMQEFERVLKPGGLIVFDEPGPHHSLTDGAQYEMRHFGVVEDDIDLNKMSAMATNAGLEFVAADVLTVRPIWADLAAFTDLIDTRVPSAVMQEQLAQQITHKQLFLVKKPGCEVRDSRDADGLSAAVTCTAASVKVLPDGGGVQVDVRLEVENNGSREWLPSPAPIGSVWIGLRGLDDQPWERRIALSDEAAIVPGVRLTVSGTVVLPRQSEGKNVTLGLVSEGVAWFSTQALAIKPLAADGLAS